MLILVVVERESPCSHPGILSEFSDIKQDIEEREAFHLLVSGRGDGEDFRLIGYDIAAQAVAKLNEPFKLVFVGARNEKEEQVKEMLLKEGISHSQLIVRSARGREQLGQQFCKADLFIMPSTTEVLVKLHLKRCQLVCQSVNQSALCFTLCGELRRSNRVDQGSPGIS